QVVLFTVTVQLLILVRALGHERSGVMPEEVFVAIREKREVVPEVTVAGLEINLVANSAIPLTLVYPAARVLREGLLRRGVGIRGEGQTVRLLLLSPLVVTDA